MEFVSAADPAADLSGVDALICPDDSDVAAGLVPAAKLAASAPETCRSCERRVHRTPDQRTAGLPVTCLTCAVGPELAARARAAAAAEAEG